jgi:hypothetical protein
MTQATEHQAICHCSQLRLRLTGAPQLVSSCHCQACQRRTGALFGSTSFWRKSQIASLEGEYRAFRRQADSGNWLVFQFCPNCGSNVFWESERQPDVISVAVGCFADPRFPEPVRTVWTESKHGWLPFPESIPHHPKNPA